MSSLEVTFFALVALLGHTYVLFPLSLPLIAEIFGKRARTKKLAQLPKVSILVSAYNEESVIVRKIQNCLSLDYPAELLEILIGNDGSKDQTAQIVQRFEPRVRLINAERNAGKAAMLNRLVTEAHGQILLFCDANTMFFPNVVRKIVQPFAEPRLGCVCGHLILEDASGSALGEGESAYWDLESEIKKFEGMVDVVIGGNGAIYAIRKELYSPLPTKRSIMDDFFVTVKVLQKGYLSTFLSSAIGTEQTSKEGVGEFKRKVRIGRANFNYLHHYLPLLNPFRPLVAYLFFSHKLLRWFSPHLLLALFFINILLLGNGLIYQISLSLQIVVLLLGMAGARLARAGGKSILTSAPYYLLTMNYALLKGFVQSFQYEKGGGWDRIARADEPVAPAQGVGPSGPSALVLAGLALLFATTPSKADLALDATLGAMAPSQHLGQAKLDFSAHAWSKFDQMVFLGVGGGVQQIDDSNHYPLLASLWLRLPIGGQMLPVATGDWGYLFGDQNGFTWRAGGGFDLKNGDHSSLLFLGGYQSFGRAQGQLYLRAGLLLEF